MTSLSIRTESDQDYAQIDEIQESAFGQPDEARLVRSLRIATTPHLSFAASDGDELVGHVFLSPVEIEGSSDATACAGLAPLAVRPDAHPSRRSREGCGHRARSRGTRRMPAIGLEGRLSSRRPRILLAIRLRVVRPTRVALRERGLRLCLSISRNDTRIARGLSRLGALQQCLRRTLGLAFSRPDDCLERLRAIRSGDRLPNAIRRNESRPPLNRSWVRSAFRSG